jgi:hypothetical protein
MAVIDVFSCVKSSAFREFSPTGGAAQAAQVSPQILLTTQQLILDSGARVSIYCRNSITVEHQRTTS